MKELEIEIVKNAVALPLKHIRGVLNIFGYSKTTEILGCLYDSDGNPHLSSLLTRSGWENLQSPENGYVPNLNLSSPQVDKAIYGGIIFDHYGHFLLETLSRAWYLIENPDMDVYFYLRPLPFLKKINSFDDLSSWQKDFFLALFPDIKNIHFITEPTKFTTLFIPSPGYIMWDKCEKKQALALSALGQRIRKNHPKTADYSGKVWLSRSFLKKGAIAGEIDFEKALSTEGFKIIQPEKLSLSDQIQLFEEADVIAGFMGSAFYTMLLAKNSNAKLLFFSRLPGRLIEDYRICVAATEFQATFYDFFVRFSGLTGAKANILQDLEKIWQVLYEQEFVKTKTYHHPDLELKLEKLDEETQKNYPHLTLKQQTTMNEKPNSKNIGNQDTPLVSAKAITHSVRRINKLTEEINPRSYLEIGVNQGQTFFDVSIAQKTAVDPKFRFDVTTVTANNVTLKEITSDDFFSTLPITLKYDVIFLDGLHTFEQTYRDFCNSLLHSHDRTVFLIDDTKPNDVYSTLDSQPKAVKKRLEAGGVGGAWHGDVFKIVFALHDFHPGFNYRTIVGSGNPQTLIWRSNTGWRAPFFNSLETISRLNYFDLLDNIDILRECSEEEAISLCLKELKQI